jgi:excisionase family DNA binding protein
MRNEKLFTGARNMQTVTDELMSRRDVAQLFRCSPMTIIRMESAGTLTPVRIGKLVRHKRADIAGFIAAHTGKVSA